MPRSPPHEVTEIIQDSKNVDVNDATSKAKLTKKIDRLSRSKKIWYTLLTLALGAAGWSLVKTYMDLKHLQGVGKVTVARLEHLGKKLGIQTPWFGANRMTYLEHEKKRLIALTVRGNIDSAAAVRQYLRLFKKSDPEDLWLTFGADFVFKLDRATKQSSLPHPRLWPILFAQWRSKK